MRRYLVFCPRCEYAQFARTRTNARTFARFHREVMGLPHKAVGVWEILRKRRV